MYLQRILRRWEVLNTWPITQLLPLPLPAVLKVLTNSLLGLLRAHGSIPQHDALPRPHFEIGDFTWS